jgi:alkanesulfonate monooxygenase SsuD/methylene tetrahydromethanopterin reductase-like flavin-dependent oxidoreductase (luciferase family)
VRFGFKTTPQNTARDAMLDVWRAADDIGIFESGWTSDHFDAVHEDSPGGQRLEGWITLAALAQATRRLRMGTLVTGIHYRHPAVLAKMAATLDIISGGRLELGLGTGWHEPESAAYGMELGSPRERSDRLEEACAVLTGLLSPAATTTFRALRRRPRAGGRGRRRIAGGGLRAGHHLPARPAHAGGPGAAGQRPGRTTLTAGPARPRLSGPGRVTGPQ